MSFAFFEKCAGSFPHVLGGKAQCEQLGFVLQSPLQTRLAALVDGAEDVSHRDRGGRSQALRKFVYRCGQLGLCNNLVDQSESGGAFGIDRDPGQGHLHGRARAD